MRTCSSAVCPAARGSGSPASRPTPPPGPSSPTRWRRGEGRPAAAGHAPLLVRSVPRGAWLGLAGLALDAHARPVVAYALRLADGKTFLRLVRPDARGRFVTRAVTKAGFPQSDTVP